MVGGAWDITGLTDPVEIGRGGFGVVYRATEVDLGRDVAVKVMPADLPERERTRFERERRALGSLSNHPHIVTIYRSGFTDSHSPFIVMEFLPDGSAAEHLRRNGPSVWTEVVELGIQLSGAIETAHRRGILHRDIKPGNVLMSSLSGAKLADFGIARLKDAPETKSQSVTASLAHAPPEVLDGARPGPQADVYSLASTLYELLAGAPAHARETDESMVPMLARLARDPVPELAPDICPPALFTVLQHAMEKSPVDRPASAELFGEMLRRVQRDHDVPPTRLVIDGEKLTAPEVQPDQAGDLSVTVAPIARPPAEPEVMARHAQPAADATSSGVDRRRLVERIAVVVGVAMMAAGAAYWFLTQDDGGDSSSTTTIPEVIERDLRGVVEALESADVFIDYDEYVEVVDPRGALTFERPVSWDETRLSDSQANPIFQVSPDIDAALREFTTPGVGVSMSSRAISPDTALRLFDGADCTSRQPADFSTPSFSGRSQLHTECNNSEAAQLIVAISEPDFSLLANFLLIDERDLAMVDRFFATLEVDATQLQ